MRFILFPRMQRQIRYAHNEEGHVGGGEALPEETGQQHTLRIEKSHKENLLLQPPRKLQVLHRQVQRRRRTLERGPSL
jgi:hypothetical protein